MYIFLPVIIILCIIHGTKIIAKITSGQACMPNQRMGKTLYPEIDFYKKKITYFYLLRAISQERF